MGERHWLLKTEPETFSIADLRNRPNRTEPWDGVRNFKARNYLRDEMRPGDRVLFYHSGKNRAVVGTAQVVTEGYPDPSAWDPQSRYFDPRCTPEKPLWFMVDIRLETEFSRPVTLAELRFIPELGNMMLLRKGNRLSVQPVTREEFACVLALAGSESCSNRNQGKGAEK